MNSLSVVLFVSTFVFCCHIAASTTPQAPAIQQVVVDGGAEDLLDCLTFPASNDCIVDFDARCPGAISQNVWTSSVGDFKLNIAGQAVKQDAKCPAIRFNNNVRSIPLDISPSALPALTIEVLYKAYSTTSRSWLVSNDNNGSGRSIIIQDSRFKGITMGVGYYHSDSTLGNPRMGQWTHLVATFENGKKSKIYRNYILRDTLTPKNTQGTQQFYIGGAAWNDHFVDADIGLVRLYADRLSDAEVKELYQSVSQCVESGCSRTANKKAILSGDVGSHVAPYPLQVASAADCQTACAASADCRQFMFNQGNCYRHKSTTVQTENAAGYESGTCN